MSPERRTEIDCRALGEARLAAASEADSAEDWDRLWKEPERPFPFKWGECWNQCAQYAAEDYAAEVGFFIDVLSLPVNTISPEFTMFTSPERDFFFAVVPASEESSVAPPGFFEL
ncbi:MAG: hypothetical protein ACYTKD_22175, partial [Planctomycetota bacterium]